MLFFEFLPIMGGRKAVNAQNDSAFDSTCKPVKPYPPKLVLRTRAIDRPFPQFGNRSVTGMCI